MMQPCQSALSCLPGIGPKWAELLRAELHLQTCEDLLTYYPYKYVDRSRVYRIADLRPDMPYVQFCARFSSLNVVGAGRKARLAATVTDGTGVVELVWFKGMQYVRSAVRPDTDYLFFGKPTEFNHSITVAHPEMEPVVGGQMPAVSPLQAFYNTTERMKKSYLNSKAIQKMMTTLFVQMGGSIPETLPEHIRTRCGLMSRADALRVIHFPADNRQLEKARLSLKFEELFYIHINILRTRTARHTRQAGNRMPKVGRLLNTFYKEKIPFEPTGAQKRVVREIVADMNTGCQMNRLVQGDVGSGKTLVALMVMLVVVDNGFQTCLMAPTEILATQHFHSIAAMLDGLPVRVELLTGSTRKSVRTQLLADLAAGRIDILIGTHALIEDTVVFANLGLAIIDEQHRFGVAQRAKLWAKNVRPPHVLVMTATPIPRTLAMTVYGDLDVSVIDELPPGRKPVVTEHYYHSRRGRLNAFVRSEIDKGRQVYVVYPLIEESEKMDIKNLTDGYEYMQSIFPDCNVSMVHGRLRPAEKDEAMRRFASGESKIMVATTVIEVGVNVPNATVMIIESAERFGLSQLHQLRGRVGRGADQSYCILMTGDRLSEDTRRRMEVMTGTTDGFEIAEADMRLRGPGNMEGTQQSGLPFELRIADLCHDAQLVSYSRDVASSVLNADPDLQKPENAPIAARVEQLRRDSPNWIMIS